MNATKAAVEEGHRPRRGVALLRCTTAGDACRLRATRRSAYASPPAPGRAVRLTRPTPGHEGAVVVGNLRELKGDEGFNALTEKYENLVEAGVIDPTKVVRSALQNAASIASLLLTTEAMICDVAGDEAEGAGAGMPGGGMY